MHSFFFILIFCVPIVYYSVDCQPIDIRHPAMSVYADATIDMVIRKIAATKVHRLFVTDKSLIPTGVVSITDVLKFASNL
jgi:predicted transcriptional regulator